MKQISIFLVCIIVLALPAWSMNPVINIQGVLRENTGVPKPDGTYSMTFELYPEETGGDLVWSETQSNVQVTDGMFNVNLGSETNFTGVSFDKPYYLEIIVEGDSNPRTRLNSSAYALSLVGGDNQFPSAGDVIVTNADIYVEEIKFPDGTTMNTFPPKVNHLDKADSQNVVYVDNQGDVGINTGTTPAEKLEVGGNVTSGNMTITGNLTTDTLKVNHALRFDNEPPIVVKQYDLEEDYCHREEPLGTDDHPPSEWVACIAGFNAHQGDWNEDENSELFQVRMVESTDVDQWIIHCNLISDDDPCSWSVMVMFIKKELVDTSP